MSPNFASISTLYSDTKIFQSCSGRFCLPYQGPSMMPTLQEGDVLEIAAYEGRPIRVGDVILFSTAKGAHCVVHRVMAVDQMRIQARGDNNDQIDPWMIAPADVTGQVMVAWRGQKRMKIRGGIAGMLQSALIRMFRAIDRGVSRRLHPLYRYLSVSGAFRCLLPRHILPRLFRFGGDGKAAYKLLFKTRVVGWYDEEYGIWRIRRPFRLFIDEHHLAEKVSRVEDE
jgi:signal peptidase I